MENTVNCPHCGELHENPSYKDENTTCITCESCDKEFAVTGSCEWTYAIEKR